MNTLARPWIRPLPPRLVNKIAAGEVVERPASVVKEIVENALDARASAVTVEIEEAGIRLIRVTDNGIGIPREQLEVAFARHATSKIASLDDLDEIGSYGFRGEALPAIASVSHMTMTSRPTDHGVAALIRFEGGVETEQKSVVAATGTVVEVANLFFNTPARKKFLKSEQTEYRAIVRVLTAMSLARPDVSFRFLSNGRQIFDTPAGDFRERVRAVMGDEAAAISISDTESGLSVRGHLATADHAVRDRHQLFLLLNGRWIQSATLAHGIIIGFGELLPRGLQPVGALHLTVEKRDVDVNIHPAKTEVRLARERECHDALYQIVKRAVRTTGSVPEFIPGAGAFQPPPRYESTARTNEAGSPQTAGWRGSAAPRVNVADLLYGTPPQAPSSAAPRGPWPDQPAEHPFVDHATGEILTEPATQVESAADGFRRRGQRYLGKLNNLYLLFEQGEDLLLVDQHTAHERVLFEEVLARMEREGVLAQQLLLPAQLQLSAEQMALFEEARVSLGQGGFVASPFGGTTVLIEAAPAILRRFSPEAALKKILDDIASLRASGYDVRKASAQSIACRSAVMRGDRLTDEEARALVEQLLECQNPYCCPHGRPTFIRVRGLELDRQFGRG